MQLGTVTFDSKAGLIDMGVRAFRHREAAQALGGNWEVRATLPKGLVTLDVLIHDVVQDTTRTDLNAFYAANYDQLTTFTDYSGYPWGVYFRQKPVFINHGEKGIYKIQFSFEVDGHKVSGSLPDTVGSAARAKVSYGGDHPKRVERTQSGTVKQVFFGPVRNVMNVSYTNLTSAQMHDLLGLCLGSFRKGTLNVPDPENTGGLFPATLDQDEASFSRASNYYQTSSPLRFRAV